MIYNEIEQWSFDRKVHFKLPRILCIWDDYLRKSCNAEFPKISLTAKDISSSF